MRLRSRLRTRIQSCEMASAPLISHAVGAENIPRHIVSSWNSINASCARRFPVSRTSTLLMHPFVSLSLMRCLQRSRMRTHLLLCVLVQVDGRRRGRLHGQTTFCLLLPTVSPTIRNSPRPPAPLCVQHNGGDRGSCPLRRPFLLDPRSLP